MPASRISMLEGCGSSKASEIEFYENLALPGSNSLAWLAKKNAIDRSWIYKSKVLPVIYTVVDSADPHTVEDIGVFHSQLTGYVLTKVEAFGQGHTFVCEEWVAQAAQVAGLIPHSKPRVRKGARVENGQAPIIVIPVDVKGGGRVVVCAVEAVQEHIVVVGVDRNRSAALIRKDSAQLPASKQVLHQCAAMIHKLFAGANRQLIDARNVHNMGLVVAGNRPLRFLVEAVFGAKIEGRKAAVGIRHVLRQCVVDQEG
jgi:hypothetical protein